MPAAPSPIVRPSAIAGRWYPGPAPALRETINTYLAQAARAEIPGSLMALVAPHAGYAYSGPTAGTAFATLRGLHFSRVVLFGPLHRPIWGSRMGPLMVPGETAYGTPLGDVPIDRTFIDALAGCVQLTAVRHDEEHSLEIELPFLQIVLGAFALVPIMFGEQLGAPGVSARLDELANGLASLIDNKTLLVVSTDLSHLDNYADVVRTDGKLVDYLSRFDVDGLTRALEREQVQACGAAGLVTALRTARLCGAKGARVLSYTNSGDVTGNKSSGEYTVGYLAAAVYG